MRSFISSVVLLLAFSLSVVVPWTTAMPSCNSEWGCSSPHPHRSLLASVGLNKRQNLTNAVRLQKRMPLLPPSRIGARGGPQPSPMPGKTYKGVIQVFAGTNSLGYIAPDRNYWTPLLTANVPDALVVSFQLDSQATSGTRLSFSQNDGRGNLLALVAGRDDTSSDIAPGSSNYLYLDPTDFFSPAGSQPQTLQSYFSLSTGQNKQLETSVWSVDITTGVIQLQWVNTDGSNPTTVVFVQSNHIYAGGDSNAFSRTYPSPVREVTLKFVQTN